MIKNIVLIWASNDTEKYGNKILKDLIGKWFNVIPVNPKEKEIEWIKCHANLWVIANRDYEIVNFVVPANITLQILQKYEDLLKNKKIWIQPWAENEEVKDFLKQKWFTDYITDSCIMLEKIS